MKNEKNISQYSTTSRAITTLSLYYYSIVMTTLSIGDSIKIRVSSERDVEKLCLRNNMLPA